MAVVILNIGVAGICIHFSGRMAAERSRAPLAGCATDFGPSPQKARLKCPRAPKIKIVPLT